MKFIKLLIIFLSLSSHIFGQEYNKNWLLGYGKGTYRSKRYGSFGIFTLSFNTKLDTQFLYKNAPKCWVGFTAASISNEEGELMFFTDGNRIFGKNFGIVQNGDTINPGRMWEPSLGFGYPQINGAYFLPFPEHKGMYYLFHKNSTFIDNYYIPGREDPVFCDRFYYTLLQENGDNGIALKKNVVLQYGNVEDTIHELISDSEMAACKHANGRDYWLVIKTMGTNHYYFYLLDSSGVRLDHIQNIGIAKTKNDWNGNSVFSKDGKRFARILPDDGLEIFDFDRCKGEFYNPRYTIFPDTEKVVSSVALSASGRFAYVTSLLGIWQYDLNEKNLEKGKILVNQWDSILSPVDSQMYYLGYFQARLAADNKIYIAHFGGNYFLHRIREPDLKGKACSSINYDVILPAYMSGSLPMFPNFKLGKAGPSECDHTGTIEISKVWQVVPNPAKDYIKIIHSEYDSFHMIKELRLYNVVGYEILAMNQDYDYNKSIDVSFIPSGAYFYIIHFNTGESIVGKFIKS